MLASLIRFHRLILAVAGLATCVSVALLFSPGLKQDYRIESFVASNDEAYFRFRRFIDQFTSNEVAVVAIESDGATSPATLALLADLGAELKQLDTVQSVVSLAEIPPGVRSILGERLVEHPLFRDNIVSADGRTAAIVATLAGEAASGETRHATVRRLRELVAHARRDHPEMTIVLAGPYVTLIDMFDYVQRDLVVFTLAAFVLLAITLWLVFRRAAPMAYAIGVAASATLCTLGVAVVCRFVTSLITQMIVILVVVLAVASCVHLAVAAEEISLLHPGVPRREQARRVLRRMTGPCTAVVATTAIGFLAVCTSSISPIRVLGGLIVFGLLLSLLLALTGVVPLCGTRPAARVRLHLPQLLRRVGSWSYRRRGLVFLLFATATAFCVAGIPRLWFDSSFLNNFRAGSTVYTSYQFLGQRLAPPGSLEIVVTSRDGSSVVTADLVRQADAFAARVVDRYDLIVKSQTLGDVLTLVRENLPQSDVDLKLRLGLIQAVGGGRDPLRAFLNADRSAMRINFRARERGVSIADKLRTAQEVVALGRDTFGDRFDIQVTGLYYFYATLIRGMLNDQYRAVAITIPAVFLVLALTLRSWRVAAVAMVPNLLPLVFCVGAMGWWGVPINMTTAMMLSVTFGIAVDDTVHYLWRYREALIESNDELTALLHTHSGVGRACVFTTVVIAGGFWILVLSEFLPTAYFGGLVGFTMLATLAADLMLLPSLLVALKPFGKATGMNPVTKTRHPGS